MSGRPCTFRVLPRRALALAVVAFAAAAPAAARASDFTVYVGMGEGGVSRVLTAMNALFGTIGSVSRANALAISPDGRTA